MSVVWTTAKPGTPRNIRVMPFRHGWVVGEAALDNAQFFNDRCDAEAAAIDFGQRLSDAGDPSEISIRLGDGASGGRFIFPMGESQEVHEP